MEASTTSPLPELDRFISLREAARQLGVSTMWLYNRRGRLPFLVRLPGGPVRVSLQKLAVYMQSAEVEPVKNPAVRYSRRA